MHRASLLQAQGLTNNGKLRPGDKARRVWPAGRTIPLHTTNPARVRFKWDFLPGIGYVPSTRESGGKPVEYHKEHVSYVVAFNAAAREVGKDA